MELVDSVTRIAFVLAVSACLAACSKSTPPKLGSMTPELRHLMEVACGPEETIESRSFSHIRLTLDIDDRILARYRERPIVAVECEADENQHIVYTSDDDALIQVQAFPMDAASAKEWLFELGRAGVDKALIAKGRARVVDTSDETDFWERDGIRVHVMSVRRRLPSRPLIGWAISATITE